MADYIGVQQQSDWRSSLRFHYVCPLGFALDAYGGSDIPTDCDYLLDHELDEAALGSEEETLVLSPAGRDPRRGARPLPCSQR